MAMVYLSHPPLETFCRITGLLSDLRVYCCPTFPSSASHVHGISWEHLTVVEAHLVAWAVDLLARVKRSPTAACVCISELCKPK